MPLRAGKLSPELLKRIIERVPALDPRVLVGPAIGQDATVIEMADRYLVAKTDPITFATDEMGWYVVQVNANDLACLGAQPRWFMLTTLLPEGCDERLPELLADQVLGACAESGIAFVGGHTEVTLGLDRPLLCGTMLGEAARDSLVRPGCARDGDVLLLTKGVPLEGAAIIAREKESELLARGVDRDIVQRARMFLHQPGISIVREAQMAVRAGVRALHDPTEGGLATAVWELCEANGLGAQVRREAIPLLAEARTLCEAYALDPLGTIASGALLIAIEAAKADTLRQAIQSVGIDCAVIGMLVDSKKGVRLDDEPMPRFDADEITKLY